MNRKQIINKLSRKFDSWVKSIDDEKVQQLVKNNAYITGGAIVSLLGNQEPKDLDIYFSDYETAVAVANYYVERWNKHHIKQARVVRDDYESELKFDENGITSRFVPKTELDEDNRRVKIWIQSSGIADESDETENKRKKERDKGEYRPVFLSANAITLANGIQLVMRFIGTPEEVHKNFDFVHCTNYFIPKTKELVMPPKALESFIFKELKYVGSRYPIASILRTRKFIKRGYKINAGQYLKMVFQLQNLDLTDPYVLEDQLNGVDLLYMSSITDAIKNDKLSNPNIEIDSTYLIKVVERIFDDEKNYDPRFDTDSDDIVLEELEGEEE